MEVVKFFRFDHIWIQKSRQNYLPLCKNMWIMPSGSWALPFDFVLGRDPENIYYYQYDVESYTDLVLDFLIFNKHEYTHRIFRSVILVSLFTLPVTGLFNFFFCSSKFDWRNQVLFSENSFSEKLALDSNIQCHKSFPMKISSYHWNSGANPCKDKLRQKATGGFPMSECLFF